MVLWWRQPGELLVHRLLDRVELVSQRSERARIHDAVGDRGVEKNELDAEPARLDHLRHRIVRGETATLADGSSLRRRSGWREEREVVGPDRGCPAR